MFKINLKNINPIAAIILVPFIIALILGIYFGISCLLALAIIMILSWFGIIVPITTLQTAFIIWLVMLVFNALVGKTT